MIVFTSESGLVKVWVKLISEELDKYPKESVPNISNLRQVVWEILEPNTG